MTRLKIAERRLLLPGCGVESVNLKFLRRLDQGRVLCEISRKFWIGQQPPKRIPGENKMCRSSATQPLKILDCLLAVIRRAVVNRIVLRTMPTLPLPVEKNGGITHVRSHDQCIGRCHLV